jgi:hypothetical protein
VAGALFPEAVMAAVERVVVNAAQALRAAVAELSRPFGATSARLHRLVERPETTGLDLFTRLDLQVLMGAMLRVWTLETGSVMLRIRMSANSRLRIRVVGTGMML